MSAMGRLAIACGGTGGHLFPGLAIAEAVRRRGHDVRFFISAKPVDRRALSGAGESQNGVEIPAVGWTGLFGAVSFLLRLVKAVRKAGKELANFKADALLGMGGFVSAASVGAARRGAIPYFLHESNAIPGRATKFLSGGAKKMFVGFDECARRLPKAKVLVTGTPVRSRLGKISKEEGLKKLGLHPKRHLVAILGGSQGARGINEAMLRGLPALKSLASSIQILHLAGEAHAEKVRHGYDHSGFHAVVLGFCDDMDAVYAGTLAELAACGVPAILVPFPAAVDDHQTANAHAYADHGAAEIVAEKNLVGTELGQRIARLMGDSVRQEHMRRAARQHFTADAAEKIAEEIAHVL
ncbi:UDP-N-acetylglucosamine--N-acetylmuramyl-(pentapeptide) pyrophosphoryl-undecaprenol N-acetylglucosamine transferase [bacterium]|nr:UDP-N-acetylglucosamine--N-acetylmuramyl-(pentapeptide) pyrophosphoryl-undecaprenol N-acetylglucosamine transferase [bacterium]